MKAELPNEWLRLFAITKTTKKFYVLYSLYLDRRKLVTAALIRK
jgi:hypothetical protein